MNKTAKNIFQTILLSSFMSLTNSNVDAENPKKPELGFNPDNEDEVLKVKNRLTTNVIKISPTGRIYEVNAHNSHSSHRSHSSHSSSSTGHYSSSWYSTKTSKSSSSTRNTTTTTKKSASDYTLGERTIKYGTYGADVDILVELLIRYHYLDNRYVKKRKGYAVYGSSTLTAIKHFQKDIGFAQSGDADTQTVTALQTWDASQTTMELGSRNITIGDCGYDVSMLIELLKLAGYEIESNEIEYCGKYAKFNDAVRTSLMNFQEDNRLQPTGIPDFKTIKKLKKQGK